MSISIGYCINSQIINNKNKEKYLLERILEDYNISEEKFLEVMGVSLRDILRKFSNNNISKIEKELLENTFNVSINLLKNIII